VRKQEEPLGQNQPEGRHKRVEQQDLGTRGGARRQARRRARRAGVAGIVMQERKPPRESRASPMRQNCGGKEAEAHQHQPRSTRDSLLDKDSAQGNNQGSGNHAVILQKATKKRGARCIALPPPPQKPRKRACIGWKFIEKNANANEPGKIFFLLDQTISIE